ncbi:MAG: hypothetical protein ACXVZP_05275 [Gaiellaceae bacterium]
MKPIHGIFAAFAVGFAVAFGTSAVMHTVQLGISAKKQNTSDLGASIASRTLALDRQQAALRAALRKQPPALPRLPHVPAAPAPVSAPAPQPLLAAPAPRVIPTVVLTRQAPVTRTHSSPARSGEERDGGGDD